MKLILILCLAVHLLICAVCLVLKKTGILKYESVVTWFLLFIPLFGAVQLLMQEHAERQEERERVDFGLAKMHVGKVKSSIDEDDDEQTDVVPLSESVIINDPAERRSLMRSMIGEVNRVIKMDDDEDAEKTVPLTESLRINSVSESRTLLMDILYTDPSRYVQQLKEASTDDDTEVVHYAVTALVEIQKKYDLELQRLMREIQENPEDRSIRNRYQAELERYITSGILSESQCEVQLHRLREVLAERIMKEADSYVLRMKLAAVDLQLKNADALAADAEELCRLWPDAEGGYLARIQAAAMKQDRAMITEIIQKIRQRQLHLSPEGRDLLLFWNGGERSA